MIPISIRASTPLSNSECNPPHFSTVTHNPLPYRQVHLDFHTSPLIEGIGERFEKSRWQETLLEARITSITLFSKCHHGWSYHPTKVGKIHPHLNFDPLRAQYEACQEIGIATLKVDSGAAIPSFTHTDGGLVAAPLPASYTFKSTANQMALLVRNSPNSQLEGFAICGEDKNGSGLMPGSRGTRSSSGRRRSPLRLPCAMLGRIIRPAIFIMESVYLPRPSAPTTSLHQPSTINTDFKPRHTKITRQKGAYLR